MKHTHKQSAASRIEEALEYLWSTLEKGESSIDAFRENMEKDDQDVPGGALLTQMEEAGFIVIDNGKFELTEKGRTEAVKVIRRHRLAERLFNDVLNVSMDETETIACELEHILSEGVTDSVCTFLGHPPLCPHGREIPRGECCKRYETDVKPVVTSVKHMQKHVPGKIVFMTQKIYQRFQRLASLGVTPGTEIIVKQRHPSIVIQVGETEIAIDDEIAREIFVKRNQD